MSERTDSQRFWEKVKKTEGCWEWIASRDRYGYGYFWFNKKVGKAHRYSYIIHKGEIPNNLPLDHLCRNTACVNPDHLEAVSQAENMERGEIRRFHRDKTHCKNGHEYSEENTYKNKRGHRGCRACKRATMRKFYQDPLNREKKAVYGRKARKDKEV